ncbi:DUF429 domain-containing protein [Solirubrobacter sp. CPCC 204708]|uniref:DUF429 domain-containing protein n=1 Tax=Solirubrobacter deserti TaxID=2282478 RepID=A0ABT4RGQ1_9ACTN|nr:DUF429 domain-containing protein [Solirubrobacter deserti]MBE2315467.1 DUF429 domain-containing protein [Solirubrobacter deserti]MDA0137690.1 DUF429 domain-containing protein [Solirubrobacter deserti]
MRTLGIDLASQPANTAACEIDWASGDVSLVRGVDDDAIRAALARADRAGIDAPFGWPEPFVAAVSGAAPWPRDRRVLTHRATDRFVHREIGKLPMSVTTDRIAYCAMRCVTLIEGCEIAVEAYPDAALRVWVGGPWSSYKRDARERRAVLLEPLLEVAPLSAAQIEACLAFDDNLDAVVCALVARAAAVDETVPPPPELARLAEVEGWIQLPRPGSLCRLGRAGAPDRTP